MCECVSVGVWECGSVGVLGKAEIRERVKERRRGLDPEWVGDASRAAQDWVMELPEFESAGVVGCYMAMPTEVQTDVLLKCCNGAGKRVCVPARCPETRAYRLALLREGAELTAGHMGIEEPAEREWVPVEGVDFIVVPGIGFDAAGGRVGYGGGNYDRILAPVAGNAGCFKVGLAFGFQVFDRVPVGDNDILMDAVITERAVLRVKTRNCRQEHKGG